MSSKWLEKFVLSALLFVILSASLYGDEIHFLSGEWPPYGWSLWPSNPTAKDVIYFEGPLDQVYSNSCYAAVAAGAEPALTVTTGSVQVESGVPVPPGTYCLALWDPVCGLAGEFGPLPDGDWVFQSTYPIAWFCCIEFHVSPALSVLAPNGGESWVAGSKQIISWQTYGSITEIFVDYSTNNGQDWLAVDPPNVGNTGSYEWTVPDVNSQQCLVRVTDAADPGVGDISDDVFTIFVCQRSLAGDLNGDCYIDFKDIAVIALDWLACGNPYDNNCWD